jgi:hypothetical protein
MYIFKKDASQDNNEDEAPSRTTSILGRSSSGAGAVLTAAAQGPLLQTTPFEGETLRWSALLVPDDWRFIKCFINYFVDICMFFHRNFYGMKNIIL